MGTAVLRPQHYLAATWRDQNSHFFPLSEYPFPDGGAFPPVYEASAPVMGRDAALCSKTHNRGGSILGRNNSAVGLLLSPGQTPPRAPNSHRRLVSRNSACGFSKIEGSHVGKIHSTPSHHSSHGSEVLISRQLSVPMMDHAGRAQRLLSDRFPSHGAQLHERRSLQHVAGFPSKNSAQSMPSRAGGAASSCRKVILSASSHFHDFLCVKRADSFDPSAHYRKRLHPEVFQVEACLDMQGAKPPLKVLADGQGRTICTNVSSIAGNKFSMNKQLNRSASDKVWERPETPNLQMPANKVGKKMVTSLADGALAGFAVQVKTDVGMTSTCKESAGSNIKRLETGIGSEGRSAGGHSSVLDTDEIWASMMNGEKWAGPSFFNSPPPSSLPVPSFTILLSSAPSAGSKSSNSAGGFGAPMVQDKSSSQGSSHTWDAAFATKDLRRMLRLDNAVVEG